MWGTVVSWCRNEISTIILNHIDDYIGFNVGISESHDAQVYSNQESVELIQESCNQAKTLRFRIMSMEIQSFKPLRL